MIRSFFVPLQHISGNSFEAYPFFVLIEYTVLIGRKIISGRQIVLRAVLFEKTCALFRQWFGYPLAWVPIYFILYSTIGLK